MVSYSSGFSTKQWKPITTDIDCLWKAAADKVQTPTRMHTHTKRAHAEKLAHMHCCNCHLSSTAFCLLQCKKNACITNSVYPSNSLHINKWVVTTQLSIMVHNALSAVVVKIKGLLIVIPGFCSWSSFLTAWWLVILVLLCFFFYGGIRSWTHYIALSCCLNVCILQILL